MRSLDVLVRLNQKVVRLPSRRTFIHQSLAASFALSVAGAASAQVASDRELDAIIDAECNPHEPPILYSNVYRVGRQPQSRLRASEIPDQNATLAQVASAVGLTSSELEAFRRSGSWYSNTSADRPNPSWPTDAQASDYFPLIPFSVAIGTEFELSHETLSRAAEANAFDMTDREVVVIGLRGALIASGEGAADWASSHSLRTTRPDHLNRRCIIGIWDRSRRRVMAFQASTVPEANYIYRSLGYPRAKANLMSTGLYRYRRGAHSPSPRGIQRGALKQDEWAVVMRTLRNMEMNPFDRYTVWQIGMFGDNIHAAVLDGPAGRPWFSSAGCQVIPGAYEPGQFDKATGAWESFRRNLGLVDVAGMPLPDEDEGRGSYLYMLLTGDDVALCATRLAAELGGYRPLRAGSTGERVAALQRSLAVRANGRFGPVTARAVLRRWKQLRGELITPVHLEV
jgi:hypothetical protein